MPPSASSQPAIGQPLFRGDHTWNTVRAAMEAHQTELARRGSIVQKSPRLFVIRFHAVQAGRRVQKSIPLGGRPGVIYKARQLLASWQAPHNPAKSPDPQVRQRWAAALEFTKELSHGRREYLELLRGAIGDPATFLRAVFSLPEACTLTVPGRVGRPRRSRLSWPALDVADTFSGKAAGL